MTEARYWSVMGIIGGMPAEPDEALAAGTSAYVVRRFYAAFESNDHEAAIRPLLSPGIVWHVSGDNPLAGTFRGHDEVFAAMRRYAEHSGGTLRLDTKSIVGDGLHAVAIHEATAIGSGHSYSAHEVDVFHVEGGVISKMWSFSEDQEATDGSCPLMWCS